MYDLLPITTTTFSLLNTTPSFTRFGAENSVVDEYEVTLPLEHLGTQLFVRYVAVAVARNVFHVLQRM